MYWLTDKPDKQQHIGPLYDHLWQSRLEAGKLSKRLEVPIYVMSKGIVWMVIYVVNVPEAQINLTEQMWKTIRRRYPVAVRWFSERGSGEVECLATCLAILIIGILGLMLIDALGAR